MTQSTPFAIFTSLRYDESLLQINDNVETFTSVLAPSSDSIPASSSSSSIINLDLGTPCLYMAQLHRDRLLAAAKHFEPEFSSATELLEADGGKEWARRVLIGVEEQVKGQLDQHDGWTGAARVRVELTPGPETSLNIQVSGAVVALPAALLFPSAQVLGNVDLDVLPKHFRWSIYIDTHNQTEPSAFTSLKTTNRDMYNTARERMALAAKSLKDEENKLKPSNGTPSSSSPTVFSLTPEVLLQTPEGRILEGSITTPYFFRNGRWTTPPVPLGHGGQRGTTRRWALAKGLCVEGEILVSDIKKGETIWVSNGVQGFGAGRVVFV